MTTQAEAKRQQRPPVTGWFKHWLEIRRDAAQLKGRQEALRVRLLAAAEEFGDEDEKGNSFYTFPRAVPFTDEKGKSIVYTGIKRERRLTPANPVPDSDKAEDLLIAKKLWLTAAQEKVIRDLRVALPYAVVDVRVDIDAVAGAYFKGIITDAEYEEILIPQTVTYAFQPTAD